MAIGTTAAILGAAAIGTVGAVGAGMIGASAAEKAAATQAAAADRAGKLSDKQYKQSREDMMPWLETGRAALQQYAGELGISDEAKAGTFKSQFKTQPGYDFQVQEGEKGVINNLAALGMKGSGAALKSLTRFRQGLADQTYQNYLTRLSNAATGGQQAQSEVNQMGQNNVIRAGQSIQDSAAARASGYVGSANAWGNALGNVANTGANALGWMSGNKGWAA